MLHYWSYFVKLSQQKKKILLLKNNDFFFFFFLHHAIFLSTGTEKTKSFLLRETD